MKKLSPRLKELTEQTVLSLMMAMGVELPLLLALSLGGQLFSAMLITLCVIALCVLCSLNRTTRIFALIGCGILLLVQFVLPNVGMLGSLGEAVKALILKFSGLDVALPLFGANVALLFSLVIGLMAFLLCKRGAGYLPAAIMLVMTLFLLWNMGRADLLWYAVPAMVALLLIIALNAHEKNTVLRALPMALIAVLLGMLLLPAARLTIPPLEKAASSLKQTITDYLFFTEDRNVFTLSDYGYYPMGKSQLGGAAIPSDYPVMIVKTDRKALLRGVIKDEYTGRAFFDSSSSRRYLYVRPRWAQLRRSLLLENKPSQAIQRASHLFDQKAITVQMQNPAASTLFVPLYTRKLNTTGDMVAYFNDASEIFITRDLKQGDAYTVYAPIFEGGDSGLAGLVETASNDADSDYASVYAEYTQLHDQMEQVMIDDVQQIVASRFSPYDKALAIQNHLKRYYSYSLTPEEPPSNYDFVTYFLYRGREGYCTYFAAAMTVMCRVAGLPARYVEGFMAQPASDGLAYVTGKDAHAWVEVYFKGFGWVPFDPTPAQQDDQPDTPPNQQNQPNEPDPTPTPDPQQPDPTPTPPDDQPNDQPSNEPSPPPDSADTPPEPDDNKDKPPFPWWILVIVAVLAAVALRIISQLPDRVAAKKATEKEKIYVYGSAINMILIILRRKPKPGETYTHFGVRLDAVKACAAPVAPVYRMLALSSYSRMQPGEKQTKRAKETYHIMAKAMSLPAKVRFGLALMLGLGVYTSLDTTMRKEAPPESKMKLVTPPSAEPPKKGAHRPKGTKSNSKKTKR